MCIFLGSVQVVNERKSKLIEYRVDHYDSCTFECKSGLVGNSIYAEVAGTIQSWRSVPANILTLNNRNSIFTPHQQR